MPKNNSKLIEEIFTLSRIFKENLSFSKETFHLTLLQLQALIFIKQTKKTQMGDIAKKFGIEMPSATAIVDNLVKENLILRSDNPDDRRAVIISLSAKGKKMLTDAIHEREKKMEKMLSFLSIKDKKDLLRVTKKINTELSKN